MANQLGIDNFLAPELPGYFRRPNMHVFVLEFSRFGRLERAHFSRFCRFGRLGRAHFSSFCRFGKLERCLLDYIFLHSLGEY